ncbi:TetR/AcrR family transcriptional regulator [Methanooceanicella nereidis]|nr:TetR/AcrR family transcriptional regulator [Methanocella sp. CWC-04]
MSKEMTREGILVAALELFSNKGYSSVTTKDIAERACISEMTLFRHFKTKRDIFKTLLEGMLFPPAIKRFEMDQFTWDLKKDLTMMSNILKDVISKNRKIIKMNMKDIDGLSENDDSFMSFPENLRNILIKYFDEYNRKNNGTNDPKLLAATFLSFLFGLNMNYFIVNAFTTDIGYEEVSSLFIEMFISKV